MHKNVPISIGVRFIAGENGFCCTYRGYNHDDIDSRIKTNERGAFRVVDCPELCTKDETDHTYG